MCLGDDGLLEREGIYLVTETGFCSGPEEVDVYEHPVKGLCCYTDNIGSGGTGGENGRLMIGMIVMFLFNLLGWNLLREEEIWELRG